MAIGIVTTDAGPLLLDHVGLSGIPFVVLDAEHTGLTPADCASAVRRLAATGTRVCVRVPDHSPPTLATFAATGAAEIVLPRVGGAADVAAAAACLRYPPDGTRSRAPSPANAYGTAWTVPSLSVIVETLDAVDNAAEIATCGLLERAWLGLADLRGELGRHRPDRPVDAVVDELLRTFGATDLVVPVAAPEDAGGMYRRGARTCYLYWDKYLHRVLAGLTAADAR